MIDLVQAATVPAYSLTPRRLAASSAALIAIISVVISGLALFRGVATRRRLGAILSLVLGAIALGSGGVLLATASGSFGTGNGVAGAALAVVLALIGIAFSIGALNRFKYADRYGEGL